MYNFVKEVLDAPRGETHLFAVGQAGFIIKSANGQLLGIDLYLSACVERVEGHVGYKRLLPQILGADELKFDTVIATHFHRDHFDVDSMKGLMSKDGTKLFAALDCKDDVENLKLPKERVQLVKPCEEYTSGNFKLKFVNCDHGKGAPEAVGVIVEVDGKRILEVGDTCLRLDRVPEYKSKGDIDVLIAPINGAYGNLNECECAELSEAIKPGVTVPCHYGMFASHGGNPGKFFELMSERSLAFIFMTQGECLTVR